MIMKHAQRRAVIALCALIALAATAVVQPSAAQDPSPSQVSSQYLRIANTFASTDAVLHAGSPDRRVALLYTHPFAPSSLSGYFCSQLPRQGWTVLCMNNRFSNNQQLNTLWEPIALDVAAGVQALRSLNFEKIVLIGYSAGGPTVAYYQALAEQGNALFDPKTSLSGFKGLFNRDGSEQRLPRADGLLLVNPSSGIGASGMFRLDPAVIDEATGRRDASLDMYAPENGFDPATGQARYSEVFLRRFRQAQCERMNRLIDQSQSRLVAAREGKGRFVSDDIAASVGLRANPAYADLTLAQSTRGAHRLLPDDVVTQVRNDRPLSRQSERNRGVDEAARTDRSFLSYRAVRCSHFDPDAITPDGHGLDTRSSNNITYANLARTQAPLLIIQGTADDTIAHLTIGELLFNASAAPDRQLWYVRGMTHSMTALRGEHGDVGKVTADAISGWLRTRFAQPGKP
jgi:pimeloyl-ACP methyl ester carboxylesterase